LSKEARDWPKRTKENERNRSKRHWLFRLLSLLAATLVRFGTPAVLGRLRDTGGGILDSGFSRSFLSAADNPSDIHLSEQCCGLAPADFLDFTATH
jgi:hypothetical protein